MTDASPPPASAGWSDYWESIEDRQQVFRIEARDYSERVRRLLKPAANMSLLDFGCGFGHTARELSRDVAKISIWDASSTVRKQAAERIASIPNIELLDLDAPENAQLSDRFDLILVHSVLQYMSSEQILAWLARWRAMLKSDGRLVLSDLIVPGAGGVSELLSYLVFAARHGFFWNALAAGIVEMSRYWKARQSRPLTTAPRTAVESWAAQSGLAVEWLDENLSHRNARATAILRRI
jgi:cyclopropane fatty-acyl-phospholipid synthase-like methyltransferase